MILEVAVLQVKNGMKTEFEQYFKLASQYISTSKGYISHSLQKCMEEGNKYLLLVKWKSLEDHTKGFRESDQYQKWNNLLHHYYNPFPIVEHYETVFSNSNSKT